jgi:hypothetical protein
VRDRIVAFSQVHATAPTAAAKPMSSCGSGTPSRRLNSASAVASAGGAPGLRLVPVLQHRSAAARRADGRNKVARPSVKAYRGTASGQRGFQISDRHGAKFKRNPRPLSP